MWMTNKPVMAVCPSPDGEVTEIFSSDIVSLKVRAWDEISEILPTRDEMHELVGRARMWDIHGQDKGYVFMVKMAKLLYPESFGGYLNTTASTTEDENQP